MSEPFIAEIRIFAGNFAPRGWAFCDGQLLPIAQNTALFSLIGTTYGGDGRTTTALPNLQGRAPMHPGRGPGLTSRRLGQKGGVETVTLTEAQMSSHNHTLVELSVGAVPASPRAMPSTDLSVSWLTTHPTTLQACHRRWPRTAVAASRTTICSPSWHSTSSSPWKAFILRGASESNRWLDIGLSVQPGIEPLLTVLI